MFKIWALSPLDFKISYKMCAEDNFYFWGAISHKSFFFYDKDTSDLIDLTY